MRISIFILLIISLSACHPFRVIPVHGDSKLKKEGVFYYLPETRLIVDITVKETHYLKGPFSQYSAKFTGISNVITENKTEYAIEDMELNSFAVPDTSKLFYIETGQMKNKDEFLLSLNEYGCITALNVSLTETSDENSMNAENESNNSTLPVNVGFEHFATGNTQVKTDTIIEKIILDTVTIEKQILQHSIIEKSLEDKAKDAADYIRLISENKMNLISGYQEVDYDMNTFNAMLGEINRMQQEYLTLFTGKTVEYTRHYRIYIDPDKAAEDAFIFSFYSTEGVSETEDSLYTDNMYYYQLIPENRTVAVTTTISNTKKNKNKGLAYNMPETCVFIIRNGNGEVMLMEKVAVCQLGVINYLPSSVRHILLDPASGSVRRIEK
ncbi:MAG TPA: DUF4831 family protein [Bacteroidales bacterium]|nr:DUF4831 family protein [Bacteroidales bacterium]